MTGYFHQLAERALQPTSALRPIVALPYARAQDLLPNTPQASPTLGSAGPWPTPAGELRDGSREDSNSGSEPSRVTTRLDIEVIEETSQPEKREAEDQPASVIEEAPLRVRATTAEPVQEAVELLSPSRIIPKPTESADAGGDEASVKGPVLKQQHSSKRQRARVATLTAAPMSRLTAAKSASSVTKDSAPDVHIHIGRIELTAVPAPAAARRARPIERKPMTLEEYLRHRTAEPR